MLLLFNPSLPFLLGFLRAVQPPRLLTDTDSIMTLEQWERKFVNARNRDHPTSHPLFFVSSLSLFSAPCKNIDRRDKKFSDKVMTRLILSLPLFLVSLCHTNSTGAGTHKQARAQALQTRMMTRFLCRSPHAYCFAPPFFWSLRDV